MIKTRMSAKMHFTIKLNLVNQIISELNHFAVGNC